MKNEGLKQWRGWWLPAHETHLTAWMQKINDVQGGRPQYQGSKLRLALQQVSDHRTAIDIGAHCGLISFYLAQKFKHVHAFEPVALHREAFVQNVDMSKVTLWPMALGEKSGAVSMHTAESSSGDTTVAGEGDIPLRRLDEVLSDVEDCDFMKLDCEGYELFALRGGEELIKRCKPVIMAEQKVGKGQQFGLGQTDAITYLKSLGYVVVKEISGDFIMKHP